MKIGNEASFYLLTLLKCSMGAALNTENHLFTAVKKQLKQEQL